VSQGGLSESILPEFLKTRSPDFLELGYLN
jgi:hypothetical protein